MNLKSLNDRSKFLADGLGVTATEPWIKVKVEVIQSYLRAFIMNASARADEIIFVDLFSGNGLYSVGYQKEVFPGPSLAALSSDLPITHWILCERDPESLKLLHRRVEQFFYHKNVLIFDLQLSQLTDKFRRLITPSKRGKYRSQCFVLLIRSILMSRWQLSILWLHSASVFSCLLPLCSTERFDHRHYLREHPERLLRVSWYK